jgi:outer membrane protein assembly factor BamB
LTASIAFAADQPQWGQAWSRNLVSAEKNLPDTFDPKTGKNIQWSVALGSETHSTPVVAGGRVLVGTNNNVPRDPRHQGDRGVLMCFDEKDGTFLWQLVVPKITGDSYLDWPNAGICSPPTVEGDRVYAISNRGEVMCLDLHGMANGNDGPYRDEGRHMIPADAPAVEPSPTDADILWMFDMRGEPTKVYENDAFHCSPLLRGRFLYVNTSNGVDNTHRKIRAPDAPSLIVLDKAIGRLVARDHEGIGPRIFHCSWASPSLGEVNGKPLVFLCGGDGVVYAFEPVTGAPPKGEVLKLKKVWSFDCDPTAPKEDVHRFITNRKESPSNIFGMPVFVDGRVFVAGGGDIWWGKNEAWLQCIDASKTGDITTTAQVWAYRFVPHTMSTPAVHDGLVFVSDTAGKLHCVDAASGKPHWVHQANGPFWASPFVADGKIYIGTRRGQFLVLAASQELRVLNTIELESPVSATTVAANGTLYVATMKRLYAARKAGSKSDGLTADNANGADR